MMINKFKKVGIENLDLQLFQAVSKDILNDLVSRFLMNILQKRLIFYLDRYCTGAV